MFNAIHCFRHCNRHCNMVCAIIKQKKHSYRDVLFRKYCTGVYGSQLHPKSMEDVCTVWRIVLPLGWWVPLTTPCCHRHSGPILVITKWSVMSNYTCTIPCLFVYPPKVCEATHFPLEEVIPGAVFTRLYALGVSILADNNTWDSSYNIRMYSTMQE